MQAPFPPAPANSVPESAGSRDSLGRMGCYWQITNQRPPVCISRCYTIIIGHVKHSLVVKAQPERRLRPVLANTEPTPLRNFTTELLAKLIRKRCQWCQSPRRSDSSGLSQTPTRRRLSKLLDRVAIGVCNIKVVPLQTNPPGCSNLFRENRADAFWGSSESCCRGSPRRDCRAVKSKSCF